MSDKTTPKPVSLQDSFPEICETLKEDNQNNEVKSKITNKTTKPNKSSFQLCQILQHPKCPHKVTVVKETFSKQCKQSTVSDDPKAISQRYIYCKEVVKPFIDPSKDEGKCPDDIALGAIRIIEEDFPKFKYCCSSQNPCSPKVKIESCHKKEKKKAKKPKCNVEEKEDSCSSNKNLAAAAECFKDFCNATKAAIAKLNDMCSSSGKKSCKDANEEPPAYPKCPKPRDCDFEPTDSFKVTLDDNTQLKSDSETNSKVTILDKAFRVTNDAVKTIAETKTFLSKCYSLHGILLLQLDDYSEKSEEQESKNITMDEKQQPPAPIEEKVAHLNDQDKQLDAEEKENDELLKDPLGNIHKISSKTDEHLFKPQFISLKYYDDDDEDEGTSKQNEQLTKEDDYEEDDKLDTTFKSDSTKSFFTGFVEIVKDKIPKKIEEKKEPEPEEDGLEKLGSKVLTALETTTDTTKATLETVTTASATFIEKIYNKTTSKVSNTLFRSKTSNEENPDGSFLSNITKKIDEITDSVEQKKPDFSSSLLERVINKYISDKSSPYDEPTPNMETNTVSNEISFTDDFLNSIKTKWNSIFEKNSSGTSKK